MKTNFQLIIYLTYSVYFLILKIIKTIIYNKNRTELEMAKNQV